MLTAEGKAKLTDFGLSKVKFETQKVTQIAGSPNWMVGIF